MRILTWNINGIRTIPQYHPWNGLKSHNEILDRLEADIINFQEVKSTRAALPKGVAVPPSYDSFFSFPIQKTGYSGVATYTRSSTTVPLKAEEGLSYSFNCSQQIKPPLTPSERVSSPQCYPDSRVTVVSPDAGPSDNEEEHRKGGRLELTTELKSLDAEGRVLTLDFGMFVLINVYCPNDGSEERSPFKIDFHRVLEARIRALIEDEGREVVLVGDLNACAAMIDHCEGHVIVKRGIAEGKNGEEWFWEEKDGRQWLRDLLIWEEGCGRQTKGQGCLVDIVRKFHPDRKGMYTCWNTKLSARDSNYGTRIDYVLVTPNLVPWIREADIQPQIKGSDHCPVYVDFHEEIVDQEGTLLQLKDFLSIGGDTPRLAAKFWNEHSGKQKSLDSFFTGAKKTATPTTAVVKNEPKTSDSPHSICISDTTSTLINATPSASLESTESTSSSIIPAITPSRDGVKKRSRSPGPSVPSRMVTKKSKTSSFPTSRTRSSPPPSKGAKNSKPGQSKVSTFFSTPGSSSNPSSTSRKVKDKVSGTSKNLTSKRQASGQSTSYTQNTNEPIDVDQFLQDKDDVQDIGMAPGGIIPPETAQSDDDDYRLALELSLASDQIYPASPSSSQSKSAGEAWKTLMAPLQPPRCTVHNEIAKEFTVNKPGANKGKKFFVCSRPVGPGYDMGRGERLREDVDPQYRCNFFKWASDVRREMRKEVS
ncbi:Class II abasic (AP) endonuclease [Paramarasmius palmivorus]|uniref:DNA-(apurinic or apyrimidinic site) endonuclease 2 n=1 Tax=Paramarasmius palmivorus TaxID=297713 RepID=A0AAW0DV31_9AGAR